MIFDNDLVCLAPNDYENNVTTIEELFGIGSCETDNGNNTSETSMSSCEATTSSTFCGYEDGE